MAPSGSILVGNARGAGNSESPCNNAGVVCVVWGLSGLAGVAIVGRMRLEGIVDCSGEEIRVQGMGGSGNITQVACKVSMALKPYSARPPHY